MWVRYAFQRYGGEANALSVPGVGHVEFTGFALNDGGIRVLAGLVFQSRKDFEVFPIGADGEIERRSALGAVVVDEDDAAGSESYGVESGVGVRWVGGVGVRA